ncbi:MAG: PLD nuclease N-terminal domain-containing protein [Verrucomicrobiia bacterium]|jgi:hypothetical protein
MFVLNPPDIEKLMAEPDRALQHAQFMELGTFMIELVVVAGVFTLTAAALRSLLMSRMNANRKPAWAIIILALPVLGACLFYTLRRRLSRR